MSAHTPGPWVLDDNDGYGALNIFEGMGPTGSGAVGSLICQVIGDSAQADANASLIAAAPDLLAALCDVIGWVPGASAWHTDAPLKAVERARAAIAKATGSAP